MRLGGPVFEGKGDPGAWVTAHRRLGYRAAYMPPCDPADALFADFLTAARDADLLIAEVGAWSNPISPDAAEAKASIQQCIEALALADRIGARCCVNLAGSRGARRNAPHPDNLTDATFDLVVDSVRQIVDGAKPARSFYVLEAMPWAFPDSPDNYLRLIHAIDRKQFAVHLDPANMINCPRRAYDTAAFLRECFAKLGPYVCSCHAKDVKFTQHLTLHIDQCLPGTGLLDYGTFLRELAQLPTDTPLMLEHLATPAEYERATRQIQSIACDVGITL